MKKQEKIELAKKCYTKIKELELILEIQGNWIMLSPPSKVPRDLFADVAMCDTDYLAKLIKENK